MSANSTWWVNQRVWTRPLLAVVVSLFLIRGAWELPDHTLQAQEAPPPADDPKKPADEPLGQFVSVAPVIDGKEFGKINRIAKGLQAKAREQSRKAILVLELADGPSKFGDVRELALFLSAELQDVRTVAWIPKDVRGYNAIVALACQEIVMRPRASLGDIGRGKPAEDDERAFVNTLVARRHNPLLDPVLVQGMLDPKLEVIWVRRKANDGGESKTELATPDQFERLLAAKTIIEDHKTIKPAGVPGMYLGTQARQGNYLCSQTADERIDVAHTYGLPRESLREDPSAGMGVVARRIRVEGTITPLMDEFIKRQIQRSVNAGATLLIFEIDSPGGHLTSSLNLADSIASLDDSKVRTVAYVPKMALSGAAMISMGCDDIVMHPDAKIGDAGPIEVRPGQAFERADEKILSFVRESMKTLAERKHRPAAIAIAMADKDYEVYKVTNQQTGEVSYMSEAQIHEANGQWVKGQLVEESRMGNLLTVNGKRANELQIAAPPVISLEELKQRYAIPAEDRLTAVGPTWVDTLVFILNEGWVTGFLFTIGIICIYAEMHMPSGLFLIGACLCFALFFWSRFLGGTADWLEVMMFVLGLVMIGLEIFVIPGFGVFGITGALLILGSLVMASQTFVLPTSSEDYQELGNHLATMGGSLASVILIASLLNRYLPRMPLFDKMILVPPGGPSVPHEGPQLRPEYAPQSATHKLLNPYHELLGQSGKTTTVLRPSGKAEFGERLVDVVSEGPFVEVGQSVVVVEVLGNRVVVRQVG